MKRDVRAHECEQRVGTVRRGLHANEVFERVVFAVVTSERRILRTIKRSAEMCGTVVGREIDQEHDQLRVEIRVWAKEVTGSMTNELRLDGHFGPRRSLAAEGFEHGVGKLRTEEPVVEGIPKWFQIGR